MPTHTRSNPKGAGGNAPEVVEPEVVEYRTTERKSLKEELVNKTVIIRHVEFREGRRGEFAVLDIVVPETGEEGEYYTFSKVLVNELRRLYNEVWAKGKVLKAVILVNEKKGYLYLGAPPK